MSNSSKQEILSQVDLLQLEEELLDISNGDIEKDPLTIEETNLVENEVVTIDKGSIKGSIKISNECKCAYGDVTTEENLVENISSENVLFFQNGKKLVCEYCDERFRCKCYLKRPINFLCKKKNNSNFCQKSLIHDNDLKPHLMHNEEKNYICNFCQKTFNQSANLKLHLNIHTKEKNYVCNFCQKVFYQPSNLKKHLNIHTKEKDYVCKFCQNVFSHSSSLKKHLNIHTKEKNYVCKFCQKAFTYLSNF
ncbi:uncharacterized protein LOC142317491 [Lycorma delicatula]|uniref:uncharacterized protein LOC142317491 n=1 Tax=Lycorma delicatula TaxID=130591 RepID=UPI003F511489